MKIVRYRHNGEAGYGVLDDDDSVRQLIGSPFDDFDTGSKVAQLDQVQLLAPVEPQKIICVGLNYQGHIKETGLPTPKFPMLFMKPLTTMVGPGDPVVYPRKGREVEYEGELVTVIGRAAKNVPKERALDHVLGYTCGNDVTERAIQRAEMKNGAMLVSKGFDTFCPLGPAIATGLDPTDLDLTTRLNGETKQQTNTSDLLFPVAELVSYISEAILLLPGDVIMTGTPSGIGPMAPGDIAEVEISGIGVLRNPIIGEE